MKPRCVHSTYFGSMPMPCESTPRRSVRTIRSAVRPAFFRDILRASSTDAMKSPSRSWLTTTGDAFEWPRIGERAHVHGAEAHGAAELLGDLLRLGIRAAEEQVTLDGVLRGGQLMGGDVVEGRDDARLRPEQLLDFFR